MAKQTFRDNSSKIESSACLQRNANKLASTLSTMVKSSHESESDFTWNLGINIGVIRSNDPNVIKFDYKGKTMHATIAPKLIKGLEKSGTLEHWFKALHDGFAQTEKGDNGIKIFGGIAELKSVGVEQRLYTDTKIINTDGHVLIFFDSSANKNTIARKAVLNKFLKEKYVETDVKQETGITKSFDIMDFCKELKELEKATVEDKKLFVQSLITHKYNDGAAFAAFKLGQEEIFHASAIGVTFSDAADHPDFSFEIASYYNNNWIDIPPIGDSE